MAEIMLKIDNIHVYYGAIHALKGVSLEVKAGEIVTLIGANGAGKSTTLRTVSGLLAPKSGGISFLGENIAGMPAHEIVKHGISQVPEGRRIFAEMSVQENLEMGAFTRKDKAGVEKDFEIVYNRFPRLKERRKQQAGTLSGGEQQMLAMGRALMSRPKLLLLDGPCAAPHQGDLFHHRGHQPRGHDRPPRRAERQHGAFHRAPRLRHGNGQDHAPRRGKGTRSERRCAKSLFGRLK